MEFIYVHPNYFNGVSIGMQVKKIGKLLFDGMCTVLMISSKGGGTHLCQMTDVLLLDDERWKKKKRCTQNNNNKGGFS